MHMDFLIKHFEFYQVNYKRSGKELSLMQISVLGLNYFKEFRKD